MSHYHQNYRHNSSMDSSKHAAQVPAKHQYSNHHRDQRHDREEVRGSQSYESRHGHGAVIHKNHSKDDHSLATATTAAFTSYGGSHSMSMDDGSIASEYGTEIVMQHSGRSVSGNTAYSRFKNSTPYSAHTFKAGNHTFTVDSKYTFTRVIGSGAYGVVISAHDTSTNTKVAIKMVPKAFQDEIDAKRILREIKLLKHLRHENIVGIMDMVSTTSGAFS